MFIFGSNHVETLDFNLKKLIGTCGPKGILLAEDNTTITNSYT